MFEGESKIFPRQSKVASGGQGVGDNYQGLRPGDIPAWEPRFQYDEGREVLGPDGNYYRCNVGHIASENFASDTANWEIIAGSGIDTNDQSLSLDGDGTTLRLSNGSNGGSPVPDKTVDLSSFVNAAQRSGKVLKTAFAVVGEVQKATVTFTTPMPSADYTPTASIIGPKDNYAVTFESVTANSFIINLNSKVAPSEDVLWGAMVHGEF